MRIRIIHGPNLNTLGQREPDIYGQQTLADINEWIEDFARQKNIQVDCLQSNYEGQLVEWIQACQDWDGLVINPAAFSHYSYAIHDALRAIDTPAIEVHLSNIHQREDFRKQSVTAAACWGQIAGLGPRGYILALEAFIQARAK